MKEMILVGILAIAMTGALFPLGAGDPSSSPQKEKSAEGGAGKKIIRGRVRVWGNEPHTYAGIETEDGKQFSVFPAEKEEEIRSLQGNLVEFTVIFSEEPRGAGALFLRDGSVTPLSWRILPGAAANGNKRF
jgi:hypothetical protein